MRPAESQPDMRRSVSGSAHFKSDAVRFSQRGAAQRLAEIIGTLDSPKEDFGILELRDFFTAGIPTQRFTDMAQTGGLQLRRALRCIGEEHRTRAFVKSLMLTLARQDFYKPFELVDAGCGPIPLFGAIATLMHPQARVTCLEQNRASACMACAVGQKLDVLNRMRITSADATLYKHPKPVDVFISETLYAGLTEEPFAKIGGNFAPQISRDGVMSPEIVVVEAAVVEADESADILSKYEVYARDRAALPLREKIPPTEISRFSRTNPIQEIAGELFCHTLPRGEYYVALSSRVRLPGNIELYGNDSEISAPAVLPQKIRIDGGKKTIRIRYRTGESKQNISVEVC